MTIVVEALTDNSIDNKKQTLLPYWSVIIVNKN